MTLQSIRQRFLGERFEATNNVGDPLPERLVQLAEGLRTVGKAIEASKPSLSDIQKRFEPGAFATEQAPTQNQLGVQAHVIKYLKQYGGIDALTVQRLGTTDARKIFTRLREKGYLYPADDANGHEDRPNASGQGKYRWHKWTGKD